MTCVEMQRAFVRSYLETVSQDQFAVEGDFEVHEQMYSWGAIGAFGEPAPGTALIELWTTDAPKETITFRIWEMNEGERMDLPHKELS